jgi:hypothetical protein
VARRRENNARKGDGTALFRLLMDLGLDPSRENKLGVSALDVAAVCGKDEILALFEREN